jgi:pyruvate dehydrogenase E2 component (dihydrolipoamide acetyltransferase)
MVYELKFADIGEGVQEGEILQWHVEEDEEIEEDQLVVEVHTEKVNVEITSPVTGIVRSIEHEPGDVIQVGDTLIKIETGEREKEIEEEAEGEEREEREEDEGLFKATEPPEKEKMEKTERILAAPAVRRLSQEMGIDLSQVQGSGPAGRITREDLESFEEGKEKERKEEDRRVERKVERIPLKGTRRTISRRLRRSKDHAAHYSYHDEVDMSAIMKLREEANSMAKDKEIHLTYLPFIVKCLTPALEEYPILNSELDEDKEEILVKNYYNIGIAIDTEEGLIVPNVKDADTKSLWELAEDIEDLANRARSGDLSLDQVQGGTFTVTSVGNIGGVMATPIINWPEVAILGVMRIKSRPIVIEEKGEEKIAIKPIMFLSISVDHRVVDGAVAARFMNKLIRILENPGRLILEEKK